MCIFDILILLCLIPALIGGLRNGFIKEAAGIVSIILGAWMAFHFSEPVCEWVSQQFPGASPTLTHVLGYVVIFIVVLLIFGLVARLLRKIIQFATLGWLDRMLGAIFSIAKAALIIGLLILIFEPFNTTLGIVSDDTLSSSKLYGPVRDAAYKIFPYLKALIFKDTCPESSI